MLTPRNGCIYVALCINRVTCCFDTSHRGPGTAESGFGRVPLAETKHKRRPLNAEDENGPFTIGGEMEDCRV
jgi:hypothetical protein